MSSVVQQQFYIFISSWKEQANCNHFRLKHLNRERNLNREINGSTTPGATGGAKYAKNYIFKNRHFFSYTGEEKTWYMVIIIKPSTKLVKFVAPGSGVQAL